MGSPMSSDAIPVIRAEGLGKRYRIGASPDQRSTYVSLREEVTRSLRSLGQRKDRTATRTFWALRDVTFDVTAGERVGIIGRNGAGKSTLLKLLARITKPTEGRGEVRGRVGSLLEVGTGFHPELTGRDNIALSGAILGMSRSEIQEKIDEIVAFAGVEGFLDTPVKRYSSGMYLRLAFAVAAHLEPEILLVDEVLAVGDAEFQKKCLGRMEEIGESGRTVLFVSHSVSSVLRLCDRVILLDSGRVIADGPAPAVVKTYLDSGLGSAAEREWTTLEDAPGDDIVRLKSVRVRSDGKIAEEIDIRRSVDIEVEYWHLAHTANLRPVVNLHLFNEYGVLLFITADSADLEWRRRARSPGLVRAVCRIPGNFLAEGRLLVLTAISSLNPTQVHVEVPDAVSFQVVDRTTGDGVRGEWVSEYPGVVRPLLDWLVTVTPQQPAKLTGSRQRQA